MKNALVRAMLMVTIVIASAVIGNAADGDHTVQRIAVPGDYGWDYMTVDAAARRLYVLHEREVVVINTDSNAIVGTIPLTKGAHGIAIAQEFGKGFISKTDPGSVTVFDLRTLKPLADVRVGDDPNCILYDPVTKRVFTAERGSKQVSAIDARTNAIVGTIGPLGGKVECAVSDEAGHVFINMQDQNTVLMLDAHAFEDVFLAAAEFEAAPAAPAVGTPPGRTIKAGSFTILVLEP